MSNHSIGTIIRRTLCGFIAYVVLSGLCIPPSFAEEFGEGEIYDLILEVKRDRETLSLAILGLEKEGKYYLPVQELARVVNFIAETDLEAGTVQGFFISPENQYRINARNGTYTLRDQTGNFDLSEAIVLEQQYGIGDIYVTPELLNKIWPLELSLDNLIQQLDIETARKLPYEMLAERQRNRNRIFGKKKNNKYVELDLPKINNDYQMFSMPALDFISTTRVENNKSGIGQSLSIGGRQDLLKTQANYNFAFNREAGEKLEFENARFLLERQSYEDNELPLGMQLMQAGDIRPRPSRLIDGSLIGRGVLVSSEPQKQKRSFDQITVEGEADPGWEVELYRGNELIDFQVVSDLGEYRFENVALTFGTTKIRTVLYGPEGQVKELEETFNLSDSVLKPGKTTFEGSFLDSDRDLILTDNEPKNRPKGLAHHYKVQHGINNWLSAFGTFTAMPTKQSDRRYATLGLNLNLFDVSSLVEVYRDLSGGHAIDTRAAGNIAGVNLNVRNAFMSDFESEETRFDGAARTSRTEFTASKPFKLPFGSIGLRFNLDHERFKANPDITEFDISQSYSGHGLRVTHGNRVRLIDRKHNNSTGRINTTYNITGDWQFRSLLNYDLFPEKDFQNLIAQLRYKPNKKFTAAVDVDRNFQNQGTRLGGQVSYDFEKFRSTVDVDWERDEGFRAFLRATMSMAPYGENGKYIFSSRNLSPRAAVNGRVFLDKDYDGTFSAGDEPIEDAIIDIGRRGAPPTDENGRAIYHGSPRGYYENVTLNTDSLENPFMVSSTLGYDALLRSATVNNVDFPVIETGVIDGTVIGSEGPLAGARIELLKGAEVIDSTTTAFDGYYTFEFVEPGTYTVRLDPSYEQIDIPPRSVSVTSENLFHYGVDFKLAGQAAEEACTEDDGRITQNCHADSVRDGIQQPAHSFSDLEKQKPMIRNVRIGKTPEHTRVTLDLSAPTDFEILTEKDRKEVVIVLPEAGSTADAKWKNPAPSVIESYMIDEAPDGGSRLILKAKKTIKITRSDTLRPDGQHGHRVYFHVKR